MCVTGRFLDHHPQLKDVFYSLDNPNPNPNVDQQSSLSSTHTWSSLKECPLSFRCRCTAKSCPEAVARLCCVIRLWRGCLVSPMYSSLHSSWHCMAYIALFVSWCFVLGGDQSLSEGVEGFPP